MGCCVTMKCLNAALQPLIATSLPNRWLQVAHGNPSVGENKNPEMFEGR